jgi:uncharacterized alpha/beta hydrolase family protein
VCVLNHTAPRDGPGNTEMRLLDFADPNTMFETIQYLKIKYNTSFLLGVGFSMGGNHLLRYLGSYKELG